MNYIEAMKQALEAIANSGDFLFNWHDCEPNNEREMSRYQDVLAMNEKAFNTLRTAIEQAEKQEPFMWACNSLDKTVWETSKYKECEHCIPLYITPPNVAKPLAAPVQEPVATDDLPKGFIPLQQVNGQLVYAACMDFNARHYKWLMRKHPAGHWVSERKLEDWEVMQVEDQDHYGIIQEAETTPPAAPVQEPKKFDPNDSFERDEAARNIVREFMRNH